ncbi:thioesterase family protein [Arthrobacter sp. ov118]|uniref:acyl-CoA thioesterase n=1 Tax=Arthrobacter sp. ov118 TaxID=1761747 RepID=UPI0008F45195|nr:thioesterase family protein [Arthrobacter sp. ov118]SFU11663.1 acyl-CoA thioester hydrolase [Arthrobacter sp. ov118]
MASPQAAELYERCPRSITVELRFDDVNSAGHLGNAALVRVLDEARIRFLGQPLPGLGGHADGLLEILDGTVGKVIGQQTIEYRRELEYSRAPLVATLWITHIGTSSFSLAAAISDTGPAPAVLAEATYILTDRSSGRPWPIVGVFRDVLSQYLGEPPQFRLRPSASSAPWQGNTSH